MKKCMGCGEKIPDDGGPYCEYCYPDFLGECCVCGGVYSVDEIDFYSWAKEMVPVCNDCVAYLKSKEYLSKDGTLTINLDKEEEPMNLQDKKTRRLFEFIRREKMKLRGTTVLIGENQDENYNAILIEFANNRKAWVPKSAIHSIQAWNLSPDTYQEYEIENWVIEKLRESGMDSMTDLR